MLKLEEAPLFIYFTFMLIYYTIAGNSEIWSGLYFCFNSFAFIFLFNLIKNKFIKRIGIILNVSVFSFCVCKFFLSLNFERFYTLVLFSIIFIGFLYLQHHRKNF